MKILVVEDNRRMADLIQEVLEDEGFLVDRAGDGHEADEAAAVNEYDLVVLDWEIPGPTGIELLRRWREAGHGFPVLMLTGRTELEDRTGGLDSGADDYLVKPFAFPELLARIRSLLRRREKPLAMSLEAADVRLDPLTRRVTLGDEVVDLAPKELAVLEVMLRRVDQVLSRGEIEEHAWDSMAEPMANVVDVTIHRLRKKLDSGGQGRLIHTVRGAGYILRSRRS
jgi:two-component system copper resistance phosphate regulon response regulator CusR